MWASGFLSLVEDWRSWCLALGCPFPLGVFFYLSFTRLLFLHYFSPSSSHPSSLSEKTSGSFFFLQIDSSLSVFLSTPFLAASHLLLSFHSALDPLALVCFVRVSPMCIFLPLPAAFVVAATSNILHYRLRGSFSSPGSPPSPLPPPLLLFDWSVIIIEWWTTACPGCCCCCCCYCFFLSWPGRGVLFCFLFFLWCCCCCCFVVAMPVGLGLLLIFYDFISLFWGWLLTLFLVQDLVFPHLICL